jgi:hypothetical protein
MHELLLTGHRRRLRSHGTWAIAGVLLLGALAVACGSGGTPTSTVFVDPTATDTPAGDLLHVEGAPVLHALVPDPAQGATYALTAEWLFVLAGREWEQTTTRNDGRMMLAHPAVPEQLFRGDHPPCNGGPAGAEMRFESSEDGGASWSVHAAGTNMRPLLVDPTLPDTLYGSDCRLGISSDAGVTWTRLDPLPGYQVVDVAIDEARLYVLGVSGTDEGRVCAVDLSDPLAPEIGDILLTAVGLRAIDSLDGRVVAGGVFGVYVSDDGGSNWSFSRNGLESVTRADARPQTLSTAVTPWGAIGVLTVELSPVNAHRIFAGTSAGLYLSQDDGATWVVYDEVPANKQITEIQFALGGADLYLTMPSGVVVVPSP